MRDISGKYRNIYVDYPKGNPKTCLIHVPGNSSDECKVMGDFGYNYVKMRPTKDHGHDTIPLMFLNRQQYNNAIIKSEADEILLHENRMVM